MRIKMMVIVMLTNLVLLSGCGESSWVRDRSNDYVKSDCHPCLKVPADVKAETCSEDYEIP